MKGSVTALLLAAGWLRDDGPADDIGECTDHTGCSRIGRWTHPEVHGMYCAAHANQGRKYRA